MIHQTHSGEFEADELLPCPFCGSEAELIFKGNDHCKTREVNTKCKNSSCRAKMVHKALRNNSEWLGRIAIENWNKRTK